MENLQRRSGGVYVARLVVPARLRGMVGKRELIASTGTHHLAVAKLVASAQLARWRQYLFDLDRLALAGSPMNHDSILKIADGHPLLSGDGHLPLDHAAAVLGLTPADVLRTAADGRLRLFRRFSDTRGYLVPLDALAVDDPERGTVLVPWPDQMPEAATAHAASGVLPLPDDALAAVAADLIAGVEADVVLFGAPGGDPRRAFVPDFPVTMTVANTEVAASDIERLRRSLAATLDPARIEAARGAQKASLLATSPPGGKNAHRLFSEGLAVYATKYLPQKITSPKEIERIRTGIQLFIDLEGDLPLGEVDADRLRSFRDDKLSTVLARENQVRIKFKTTCMTESIRAVAGLGWPNMSPAERNLRMQWIARMFKWLKEQKWISDDPATGLRGESVESKAERKVTAFKQKPRTAFTDHELKLIFAASWFTTGRGELTSAGTYREFRPFQYWLPLLGLYTGARINELCQLRLVDIALTEQGTWYLDINTNTVDKSLKAQKDDAKCWSVRKVPLHPEVIRLGFVDWCARLKAEGFQRLFPELSWNPTTHYAKEPIRSMSRLFASLDMPRDNTKVFHSFRHGFNNAVSRTTCTSEMRKRLMGHEPGAGVNEQHYLADPTPDETGSIVKLLAFDLPTIAAFDIDAGVLAVQDALRRKAKGRGGLEDLGERPST